MTIFSNKKFIIAVVIIVTSISLLVFKSNPTKKINLPQNINSIIISKETKLTAPIVITNIDEFINCLCIDTWEYVSHFDLKCSPEYFIAINSNELSIIILCQKDQYTYIRVHNNFYRTNKDVLTYISSLFT